MDNGKGSRKSKIFQKKKKDKPKTNKKREG